MSAMTAGKRTIGELVRISICIPARLVFDFCFSFVFSTFVGIALLGMTK